MSIDKILEERKVNYGSFNEFSVISQSLKITLHNSKNWDSFDDDVKESLEMIVHKISRILNGNPNYVDSWTDIIGYSKLIEDRLKKENKV